MKIFYNACVYGNVLLEESVKVFPKPSRLKYD